MILTSSVGNRTHQLHHSIRDNHRDIAFTRASRGTLGEKVGKILIATVFHFCGDVSKLLLSLITYYSLRLNDFSVGWTEGLAMMPYNNAFRLRQKLAHMLMGTKMTVVPYLPLQDIEVHRFLFRVLQEPELFLDHIRTYVRPSTELCHGPN